MLLRLTNAGTLDGSFGTAGIVFFDDGGQDDVGVAAEVDSNDAIVLAVNSRALDNSSGGVTIQRYLSAGQLDAGFAGGSVTTGDPTDRCSDMLIDPGDRPTIVGSRENDVAIWRYLDDGTSDTSLDTDGLAVSNTPSGETRRALRMVRNDLDGALIVCGIRLVAANDSQLILWRFRFDGSPELLFGAAGIQGFQFPGGEATAHDVKLDAAGNIVVAGVTRSSSNDGIDDGAATLWRFDPSGVFELGFGGRFDERTDTNVVTSGTALVINTFGEIEIVGSAVDLVTCAADLGLWRMLP